MRFFEVNPEIFRTFWGKFQKDFLAIFWDFCC